MLNNGSGAWGHGSMAEWAHPFFPLRYQNEFPALSGFLFSEESKIHLAIIPVLEEILKSRKIFAL